MDEYKFWLGLFSIIAIMLIAFMWINHLNEKQFIEHGFTRESLPGQSMTQWVKK